MLDRPSASLARIAIVALTGLACAPAAAAATIVPGDSFTLSLRGVAQGGSYLLSSITATFGTYQTFAGAGPDGQTIAIASGLVGSQQPGRVVAIFTLSTPVSFIQRDSIDGNVIAGLVAAFGGETAADDAIDFTAPPTGLSTRGIARYRQGTSGFDPVVSVDAAATGYRATGSWTSGSWTVPVSGLNPNTMSVFLEFDGAAPTPVPEPAGWMLMIAGFALTGAALRRRASPNPGVPPRLQAGLDSGAHGQLGGGA